MTLETNDALEFLQGRLAIETLIFNYAHGLDSGDEHLFAGLWSADARWWFPQVDGLDVRGIDSIMSLYRKTVGGRSQMHHLVSNIIIEIDGDRARGRCSALSTGHASPHFVSYDDEYTCVGGQWQFLSRKVIAHLPDPSKLPDRSR